MRYNAFWFLSINDSDVLKDSRYNKKIYVVDEVINRNVTLDWIPYLKSCSVHVLVFSSELSAFVELCPKNNNYNCDSNLTREVLGKRHET